MIPIHGKEYATVAHRIAVVRRNLGAKLQILTEIISADKETVVMKASGLIGGKVIATGHAEEKKNCIKNKSNFSIRKCRNICCWQNVSNGWNYQRSDRIS